MEGMRNEGDNDIDEYAKGRAGFNYTPGQAGKAKQKGQAVATNTLVKMKRS